MRFVLLNQWKERVKGVEPSSLAWKAIALPLSYTRCFYILCLCGMFHYGISFHWCFIEFLLSRHPFYVVGSTGFEPVKALPSDLQSDPFDRSGNSPSQNVVVNASFCRFQVVPKWLAYLFFSFKASFWFFTEMSYRPRPMAMAGSVGRQSLRPVTGIRTTTESTNGRTSNSFHPAAS